MGISNGKDVFIRQLSAMRNDGYEDLQKVQCPTLILASRNDQMRSVEESQLMADRIARVNDCDGALWAHDTAGTTSGVIGSFD